MPRSNQISLADFPAERIGLLKPSALGDIVHALPVLTALRRRFPRAHITWIVNRSYEPLLRGHPHLNELLGFDRKLFKKGVWHGAKKLLDFYSALRQQRFDLLIDLQCLLRSGLIARASGAARRVGLSTAREGAAWFYTDVLPVGDMRTIHAVDRYWLVAEALGVGDMPKQFVLPLPAADRQWVASRLQGRPRPWLMMCLGTRWETKRWPVAHFTALARRALSMVGGTVVLVGGPEERQWAEALTAALPGPGAVCSLVGKTTLPQLTAVLSEADVVITNDSGPLHLAAALGKPVVAPYTCTSPIQTGPYGQMHGAIATQVYCAASYLKHCNRMDCMKELTPDRLWPALERILRQCQRRSA
jgi:heptosyltransferase I